jgi:hypothetical protein
LDHYADKGNLFGGTPSFDQIITVLRNMIVDILSFNEIFAHVQESDRAKIQTPTDLVGTWMHIVLALATYSSDSARFLELIEKAGSELKQGLETMINAMSETTSMKLENTVVLPLDLVLLMSMRLLQDVTPGLPDISATYWSSLLLMVSRSPPLGRYPKPLTPRRILILSLRTPTGEPRTSSGS